MGKRIVITTYGTFGDVYPYIGLALALKARGHEPVMAVPSFYRQTIEGEGLEFHAVRPNLDLNDRAWMRRLMDPRTGAEMIVRECLVPTLRETYADLVQAVRGAALLITHVTSYAGRILAEQTGLPWVSTVLAPMSFMSVHDLAVFPPVWREKRLERIPGAAAALIGAMRFVTRRWAEPVYEFRRQLGLPRGENPLYDGQHSPQLALALFSPVLGDRQPDWPAQVQITGAIPFEAARSPHESARLEAFLAAGPPPIVFTLGTSAVGAAGAFYHESVEAARGLGMRAVLLVGSHAENRPKALLSDDVLLEPYAAYGTLFPRAVAVVHQGGAGTLYQGLRAGRPMLIVPHAFDQPDNAIRAVRLGVARIVRTTRYTAPRVRRELATLLHQPGYTHRAAAVADHVRAEDGVVAACRALAPLLQESTSLDCLNAGHAGLVVERNRSG